MNERGVDQQRRKRKTDLKSELRDFIKEQPSNTYSKSLKLHLAWESVATEQELEHSDNVARAKDKKDTILIFVDNSHWAAELSAKKELYRLMLEKELKENIKELKFLVSRSALLKKVFSKKSKQKNTTKNGIVSTELSEKEDSYTREMVVKIKNEELKLRLYNAIKKDFELKKGRGELKLSQNTPESPETI